MDEANPDDVGVTLSVESVIADTEARRSTWETVSQVVPSPRAVLAMPVVLPADPEVSREEWSLLALVDGRRSVTELVDLTGSGQYAVVSTLAALVQRGLLEVRAESGEADDHVTVVVRRQRLLAPLEDAPFVPVQETPTEEAPPRRRQAAREGREGDGRGPRRLAADDDGDAGQQACRPRTPDRRRRARAGHRHGRRRRPGDARRGARPAGRRAAAARAVPAQAAGRLRRDAVGTRRPRRARAGGAVGLDVRARRRRRCHRDRSGPGCAVASSSATPTSTAA